MKSSVDIAALAGYAAGGGLAGVTGLCAVIDPKHALLYAAAMGAVISIAGAIRIIANPTGTNSVSVFDRNTGSTVTLKTADAPSTQPAAAPVYAKDAS